VIRGRGPGRRFLRMGFGLGISGMISPMGMGFGRDPMGRGLKACGRMGAMRRQLEAYCRLNVYKFLFILLSISLLIKLITYYSLLITNRINNILIAHKKFQNQILKHKNKFYLRNSCHTTPTTITPTTPGNSYPYRDSTPPMSTPTPPCISSPNSDDPAWRPKLPPPD
jgi:hypothetical protein